MSAMKELYLAVPDAVIGYATAYPLVTCIVLGLAPVAIVALSRNVVGLSIVGCVAAAGFALAFLVSRTAGPVSGWWLALWGALWVIALAFLVFGRPAPGVVSAGSD
jgi:hypothetical protein